MKRRRRKQQEDEPDEDPLETLGLGRDRYFVDEDDEDVREKQELRAINALQWEM